MSTFTDWDDPYWACEHCGCAQADHETRTETEGFGAWTTHHAVTECVDCGQCDGFEPADGWTPTELGATE